MTRPVRIAIAMAVLAAVVVAIVLLPVRQWAVGIVEWVRGYGARGALLFALVYVASGLLATGASALTLGAGFVYGPVWGTVLVTPSALLAAMVAFAIARRTGRGWLLDRVTGNERFRALDRAVERHGFKITMLARLSPVIPYGVLNYALGFTGVSWRAYALASAIGMLPGTIAYVYVGSLLASGAEIAERPEGPVADALYWGGLAITLIVAVVVTVIARNALRRELRAAT